eukprot:42211-Pyramimonas_sp.AAC.1
MPQFLRALEEDLAWCVLLLQECFALRCAEPPEHIDGHRILVVPPPSGNGRKRAIVAHRDCGWKVQTVVQGT